MKLTGETKFFIGIILATLIIVAAGIFFMSKSAPSLTREELIVAGVNQKGNVKAADYLVEFSDFECPACGSFHPVVKEVVEKNKEKLSFAYRHFPLQQHPQAIPAALASEAAGEQGKFWEMHDYIFENQESLSEAMLYEAAEKLGLDKEKFETSYKEKKFQDKINKDLADGQKFGVNSTPTFYLNGKKLDLFSSGELESAVEEAIKN